MNRRYLSFIISILLFGFLFYSGDASAIKEETPVLKKLLVKEEEKKVRILIEGSASLSYTIFKLSDPPRVVIDLAGTEAGPFKGKMAVGKDPVTDISTSQKDKPGKLVRIEIGLSSMVDVTPSQQDNKLFIDIQKPSTEAKKEETSKVNEKDPKEKETTTEIKAEITPPETKPTVPSKETKKEPPARETKKTASAAMAKQEKPGKIAKAVTGLKIDKEKGLKIIISGDGEMKYDAFILKPNRLVIDIPDAINKARPVSYNVADSALTGVRIGQHKDPKNKVRIVLDLTGKIPYEIIKEGNQLIITLNPGEPSKEPMALPKKKDVTTAQNSKESSTDKKIPTEKKDPVSITKTAKHEKVKGSQSTKSSDSDRTSKKYKVKEVSPIKTDNYIAKEITSIDVSPPVLAQKTEEPAPAQAEAEKASSQKASEALSSEKYTGRKISLDFQDADIISILRIISEVSGMNIITSPDVKGKISVKMLNVPWDQALDIILKTHHLGKVVEDNIIRVSPVATLAKERDDLAKAKESLAKSEDLVSRIIPLGYSKPGPMKEAIEKAKVLSPRGNVSIDERTNTLIVKDISKNLAEAESLIKILDKPTPQVSIEAKIVEANTSFARELGIQWGFKNVQSAQYGNSLPYTFPHSMTIQGTNTILGEKGIGAATSISGSPWALNLPAAVGAGSGGALGLTLGSLTNSFNLDLQLSALENTGNGKILSNPKITTLDNEKALIKQGKRIPFPTTSAEGTKIEFVDAVLSLTVTPTITPGGSISMKIEIAKNEADFAHIVLGVPTIDTKEATASVLVKDGETLVIGGIMKSTKSESLSGVPLLHRIPFLGWLFKKETLTEDTTELLIFITPRIVTPS